MTLGDKNHGEEFNQVFVKIRCIGLEIYVLTGLNFAEIPAGDEFKLSQEVFLCNRMIVDILRIKETGLGHKFLVVLDWQMENLFLRHPGEDGKDLHLFVDVLQGFIPGDLLDLHVFPQGEFVVRINYVHICFLKMKYYIVRSRHFSQTLSRYNSEGCPRDG